jgi:hypothetical protein
LVQNQSSDHTIPLHLHLHPPLIPLALAAIEAQNGTIRLCFLLV